MMACHSSERKRGRLTTGPRKDGVKLLSVSCDELLTGSHLSATCRLLAGYALADAQTELAAIERFNALVNDPAAGDEAVEAAKDEMERASAIAVGSFERYRTVHLAMRRESEVLV